MKVALRSLLAGAVIISAVGMTALSPANLQAQSVQSDRVAIANMGVRLSQMEAQLRQFTGQIEQQNFQIRQLQRRVQEQARLIEKLRNENAMVTLPESVPQPDSIPQNNALPTTLSEAPAEPANTLGQMIQGADGQTRAEPSNPTFVYDAAFSLLQKGDYDAAEKALNDFIVQYPKHSLTANAQYWLGESYYVRNNYKDAAKAFALGYQNYPKGAKAPDNLLKLALSLSNLGQKKEACVTLMQLSSQYPAASTAIKNKARQISDHLTCG